MLDLGNIFNRIAASVHKMVKHKLKILQALDIILFRVRINQTKSIRKNSRCRQKIFWICEFLYKKWEEF